nr:lysozyme-like protein 6 [Vicugna pacos]
MSGLLLVSLVSCLLAMNQASLISRCDLAKVLREEDLDGFEGYSLSDWLCLAFVESAFNITKVDENTDGSFDYGIFQINSHYWCNDYQSHTENICHMDCQGVAMVFHRLQTGSHSQQRGCWASLCAEPSLSSGSRGRGSSWVKWRLHCAGRPLSYWMTGCHLG